MSDDVLMTREDTILPTTAEFPSIVGMSSKARIALGEFPMLRVNDSPFPERLSSFKEEGENSLFLCIVGREETR